MAADTIFINGRFLTQPMSGVQRYAHEIVRAIDAMAGRGATRLRCVLLTPRGAPSMGLRHVEQRGCGRLRGHGWDQIDFALAARRGVALCLAQTGPVALARQVAVIHDASVQRHPEHYSRAYVAAHRTIDALLARRAVIATVSEFSRGELSAVLGVPADAIVVAPNGAEHLGGEGDPDVLARLGLVPGGYFMTLGNLTRNKNVAVVLRALARIAAPGARLVAVGRLDPAVFGRAGLPEAADNLVLPGRLDDAEVAALMRSARALVFPSIYEGFGIPPLEAFANGCPVIASTAPAIREVCGPAADYFDPHDDAALAALMRRWLADDGTLRAQRVAAGRERLARYAWPRSAETLVRACERLAAEGGAASRS